MSASKPFRIGVSFHSFTNEYCSFAWSFEDMMQHATQLGGGIEIVGPSHHRGFPEVTDEFERIFKSSVERNQLIPTCYGSYADPFMLPDRDLTPDELVAYTIPQLKGASKLGFPIVRLQYFVSPVIERLLPYAEKYRLKMGYELHVPLMIESPKAQGLIEQVKRLSSEYLGLIPDCGIFARSVPKYRLQEGRDMDVPEPLMQRALELWSEKTPLEQALVELEELGLDKKSAAWAERNWGSFGYSEPASLAQIMPYIIHFHGKFFTIENEDEPDIRYEEVVRALLDGGYSGWMSSEYEGATPDSLTQVQAHQAMVKRYIARYSQDQTP